LSDAHPNIVQVGHPVLRRRAQAVDVDWIGTPEFDKLVDLMVDTMREAPGVGVAAPQVGVSKQMFVFEDRYGGDDEEDAATRERPVVPLEVVVNPTLDPVGDHIVKFYEGCLSINGFAAVVPRHKMVRVRALDRKGEPIELEWQGWPARILQHEYDHLQGTLYIDRMNSKTYSTVENLGDDDD